MEYEEGSGRLRRATARLVRPASLRVAGSTLGPRAGAGLFAADSFAAGAELTWYTGTVYRTRDALRLADKTYLMRLGEGVYVDARTHLHVVGRYANDCRCAARTNARFDKQPARRGAAMVATRPIAAGDEVFVDYGRWYVLLLLPLVLLLLHCCCCPATLVRRRAPPANSLTLPY